VRRYGEDAMVAHLVFGVGTGLAFGFLRQTPGQPA
jgi:hypothetical protein